MYTLLNEYMGPGQIKRMSLQQLNEFSNEIREFLVEKVSKTGGHLASNLGVVELTISLYNVFDFEKDKLIWDVGHQAYVHKILTGRKDKFDTLRQYGGLSGFPKRNESSYDMFDTGHSSTSLSAALGMAKARDLKGEKNDVVAVIGDGALTGGMAFEALNDIGYSKTKMIIILNDNQMSISKNVGGMSTYLSKVRLDPNYNKLKEEVDNAISKIPNIGKGMTASIKKIKNGIKQIMVPSMLFEDMGIKYLGPIDGHNIKDMSRVLKLAKNTKEPVIIHVITKKGKGYEFAEKNPGKFHGIGPFDCDSGEISGKSGKSYSSAFGDAIVKLAEEDDKIVAITAAMKDGTGLSKFAESFPKRFFDVGIAEQHAVTMAAGMACAGLKPVFAVYSTFLQRAYDQVIHDICIQKLPVTLAIDRAGIVGDDGETHQGVFDLSFLTQMPNMTIMCPKSTEELKYMFKWAINFNGPVAIRYPRGGDSDKISLSPIKSFSYGKWEVIHESGNISLIATGRMVQNAVLVREKLKASGIDVSVINAAFVKPIDENLLKTLAEKGDTIITLEDNVIHGGFGSMVLEFINSLHKNTKVINLGFKDEFIPHGNVNILYKLYGLDVDGIVNSVLNIL
ncbi:MAG: dxs [Clostridiaceae bacterium]|jgi:1-deoxy-D-xylulose-5-phosphate synthase|nr:dxs [Clostridiaceae bacterium]